MRNSRLWLAVCGMAWAAAAACLPPGAQAHSISDVARDMNVATRFGRMDVAIEHTAEAHRSEFVRQRAAWGKEIRILDVELSKLDLQGSDAAEIFVDVGWMRMDEGLLRSTRLKQQWHNDGSDWLLGAEERLSGDVGLLGENVVVLRPDTPRDVHFPVKTLQGSADPAR